MPRSARQTVSRAWAVMNSPSSWRTPCPWTPRSRPPTGCSRSCAHRPTSRADRSSAGAASDRRGRTHERVARRVAARCGCRDVQGQGERARTRGCFFEPAMHTAWHWPVSTWRPISASPVANDDLWVGLPAHLQPHHRDGSHSAEALARWDHPTLGSISPVVFIPIAEDSDLITHIGRAGAGQGLAAQAAAWRRDGVGPMRTLRSAVNVSAKQLHGCPAEDRRRHAGLPRAFPPAISSSR